MKRFLWACAVVLCGPAFGNEREDSEAELAALAGQISAALGTAMPEVEGMVCEAAAQDTSPTNRLLLPNWQGKCSWEADGAMDQALVILVLSPSLGETTRNEIAKTAAKIEAGELPADFARFAGSPEAPAMQGATGVKAVPSAEVVGLVAAVGNRTAAAMDKLADALAGMDLGAVEAMPEVAAHRNALAAHRALLEGHVATLAMMLPPAVDGRDPAARPAAAEFPDHMFFGFEPLVQVQALEAGVTMTVTLTTSSFALENARLTGQFAGREKNGEMGADGVFHDRGRVQVYLRETHMTALIDGRGMLLLDVPEVAEDTDPIAAMEAVLARIAANDFSGY